MPNFSLHGELLWYPLLWCNLPSWIPYVMVLDECFNWTFEPYANMTWEQSLSMNCTTYELSINGLSGNTVDLSCLLYTPPSCYNVPIAMNWWVVYLNEWTSCESSIDLSWVCFPAPLTLIGSTLYTNEWESCESSVDLSSIIPAPYIPSLQEVCDVGNTTDTDIEITDLAMWIILKSTDWTRHRITLVDDTLGNYNLDISAAL